MKPFRPLVIALAGLVGASGLALSPSAAAEPGEPQTLEVIRPYQLERASVSTAGDAGNAPSGHPTMSGDGRFVLFESQASNLDPDYHGYGDYLHDRQEGTTRALTETLYEGTEFEVEVPIEGSEMVISEPGTHIAGGVAVVGDEPVDPVPATVGVYALADLTTRSDVTTPAPLHHVSSIAISDDAGLVAFAGDVDMTDDGMEWKIYAGEPGEAAAAIGDAGDAAYPTSVALSGDGTRAAWQSYDAVAQEWALHALDLSDPAADVVEVGVIDSGEFASDNASYGRVALTDDGDTLVTTVADDGPTFVRVFDLVAGTHEDLPPFVGHDGLSSSSDVAIDDDAGTIAFQTYPAFELGGGFPAAQVYVYDVDADTLANASSSPDGLDAACTSAAPSCAAQLPALSSDGSIVAFAANADNLVADDDETDDIFVGTLGELSAAPTWPSGAEVRITDVDTTSFTVEWDEAEDDEGVTAYRVYLEEGDDTFLLGSTTSTTYSMSNLSAGSTMHLAVEARDADGQVTSTRIRTVVELDEPDVEEPTLYTLSVHTINGTAGLSWPTRADATGYRVFRASSVTPDVFTELDDTSSGSPHHQDITGLAGATYIYRVDAIVGGSAVPHTSTATFTFAALQVSYANMSAPQVHQGLGTPGGNVTFRVDGSLGREVSATVAFESWFNASNVEQLAPVSRTAEVAFTEGDPGVYNGSWAMPAGVTRITGATYRLTDGNTTETRVEDDVPLPIAGTLNLQTTGDPAIVAGARARVVDYGAWGSKETTLVAGNTHSLGHHRASTQYFVDVVDAEGISLANTYPVTIRAGMPTTVTLTPVRSASLTVDVLDAEGEPVPGALYSVSRADRYVSGGMEGQDAAIRGLREGQEVEITAQRPYGEPYASSATATITLAAGTNDIDIELPLLPTGTISGVVTKDDDGVDSPLANATVAVEQSIDGFYFSAMTTTGADGSYTIEALAGDAEVTVSTYSIPAVEHDVTVVEDVVTDLDVEVFVPRSFPLLVTLRTQYTGGALTTIDLDWRTAVHYRMGIRSPWDGGTSILSPRATVRGIPGGTIQVCADGVEGGLPASCTPVVLPADVPDDSIPVTVDLVQTGGAHGRILRGGEAWGGTSFVYLSKLVDDRRQHVSTSYVRTSDFTLTIPEAASYLVEVWSNSEYASTTIEDAVLDGETIELGDLELDPRLASAFGGDGNRISSAPRAVLPGGRFEVRAALRASNDATDAVARVDVPVGATIPENGVTVDGEPVEAVDTASGVEIQLGDVLWSQTRVVRVAMNLPADLDGATEIRSEVEVEHAGGTESVGTTSADVIGVTMDAPTRTASRELVVTGRASKDAEIEILAGSAVVGTATAKGSGHWKARLSLPDRGQRAQYKLTAVAQDGGTTHRSAVETVIYDGTEPVITEVTIQQQDGRLVSFDPRDGVAKFPYVFVPGMPTTVKVRFDDPTRVDNVVITVVEQEAEMELNDEGLFEASLVDSRFGDVSVEYDVTPGPFDPGPVPSEADVRERVPATMSAFEVQPIDPAENVEDSGAGVVAIDLPSGGTMEVDVELTPANISLTAEERAAAARTGVPAFRTTVEYGEEDFLDDDTSELVVETYLTCADLPAGTCDDLPDAVAGSSASAKAGISGSATSMYKAIVRLKAINWADETSEIGDFAAKTAWDTGTAIYGEGQAAGAGDKYKTIGDLYTAIGNCPPAIFNHYKRELDLMMTRASGLDGLSASLTIAGLFLGGPLGAIGGFVVSEIAGKSAEGHFNGLLDALKAQILAEPCTPDDDGKGNANEPARRRRRPRKPLANPTPIYDPSGYVYEGVESNRLEGVTTTVMYSTTADGPDGPWVVWDAEWFGQANPLVTDANGRYGWDVPEGYWQVVYAKDGYETGYSEVLQVLPPHFDVNEGLVSLAAPVVESASATATAATFTFDKPMIVASVTDALVTVVVGGASVNGTISAVDAEESPDGVQLADTFRFTPASSFAAGATVGLTIDSLVQSYAGRGLAADDVRTLSVPAAPVLPDDGGGGGDGEGGGNGNGGGGGSSRGPGRATANVPVPSGGRSTVRLDTAAGPAEVVLTGSEGGQVTVEVVTTELDAPGLDLLPTSFEVDSTMPFDSATVCLPYSPGAVRAAGMDEASLSLFHGEEDGTFTDVTNGVDTTGDEVCGTVTSFSPFAIGASRTERLSGADRYATAARISESTFERGVDVAYVASGTSYADALAAGPVAARFGGPVLLTASDELSTATAAELERLQPERVVVVGGTAAISDAVEAEIDEVVAGPVERVAGADRYATAVALSASAFERADVVYLATGQAFPDALAGGVLAAIQGAPILLVADDPTVVASELDRLDPTSVVVLGGTSAVSDALVAGLGKAVRRLAGVDRYATAAAIAREIGGSTAFLATGESFADALAGVPAVARAGGVLVLTSPTTLPSASRSALEELRPAELTVLGGTAAVSRAVELAAARTMPG